MASTLPDKSWSFSLKHYVITKRNYETDKKSLHHMQPEHVPFVARIYHRNDAPPRFNWDKVFKHAKANAIHSLASIGINLFGFTLALVKKGIFFFNSPNSALLPHSRAFAGNIVYKLLPLRRNLGGALARLFKLCQ